MFGVIPKTLITSRTPGPPPGPGCCWLVSLPRVRSSMKPLVRPRLEALWDSPTCLSLRLRSPLSCIVSNLTGPAGFFPLLTLGEDYNFWSSGASPGLKNLGVEFKQALRILSFKPIRGHFRAIQVLKQGVNRNQTKPTGLCKGSTCLHQERCLCGRTTRLCILFSASIGHLALPIAEWEQ